MRGLRHAHVIVAKAVASLIVFGVIIFFATGCSDKATAVVPVSCFSAPASFLGGGRELRFPKPGGPRAGPLCYDIVLQDSFTSYIYPPLENGTGSRLIRLITPGAIEVHVKDGYGPLGDGGTYRWTETAESLNRSGRAWDFKEKCMIFRIKGHGTARIIVDRHERMEPGGIERSTHCPGMY